MISFLVIFLIIREFSSKFNGKEGEEYSFGTQSFLLNFSVFFADMHSYEPDPFRLDYYRSTISKIHEIKEEKNIKFAFLAGDFTESSTFTQWDDVIKVTETLEIQWIPLIGNHDIFFNNGSYKEPKPTGDYRFNQAFQDRFTKEKIKIGELTNYSGGDKIFDKELGYDSYYQNFVFEYDKTVFIGLDWNCRDNNPKMKGPSQWSCLHDFEGGTFDWFKKRISEISSRSSEINQIVFVQHHPFVCNPIITKHVPCKILSFDPDLVEKIRQTMVDLKFPFDKYYGNIVGHMHQWFETTFWGDKQSHQANAVMHEPCFFLVTVKEGKIEKVEKYEKWE